MLAYTLKNILELVPEALPLVKKASIDQEMPLDSEDSTIATALQLKYFEKVAYHPVDLEQIQKIAKAVDTYRVKDKVNELCDKMTKAATASRTAAIFFSPLAFQEKMAAFNGAEGTISERIKQATDLYKEASDLGIEPTEEVKRYSGHMYLDKNAAVRSLKVRANESGNETFEKMARMIENESEDPRLNQSDSLVKLAQFITNLDNESGLNFKGFNFFNEAFVKEASYNVKLAGKVVPYEKIASVGYDNVCNYIGKDVADEMNNGPEHFKQVAETLPLDLQHILLNLTKNV
jgi:hypothetical protein